MQNLQDKETAMRKLRSCASQNAVIVMLWLFFMMFFGNIFIEPLISYLRDEKHWDSQKLEGFYYIVYFSLQFLIVFPVLISMRNSESGQKMKTWFRKPNATFGFVLKWACIAFGAGVAINLIQYGVLAAILSLFKDSPQLNDRIKDMTSSDSGPVGNIAVFVSIAFLAPIFEELILRGAMLTDTVKHGKWFAVVNIGILFGLFHMNYSQILYAAGIGMVLCFVALKTGSIIPCIFIHFFNNLFGAVMSFIMRKLPDGYLEALQNRDFEAVRQFSEDSAVMLMLMELMMFVTIAVAITGIVFLIIELQPKNRHRLSLNDFPSPLTTKEKIKAYYLSPYTVALLVIVVIYTGVSMFGG